MSSKIISLLSCLFILQLWAATSVTGQNIGIYEIKKGDFSVKVTNYGARIISVFLPDKNGKIDDVALGYDTIEEYKNDANSFGALLGRVANRIGGAQFTLNGTLYKLSANDGANTLHGGFKGFSKVVWNVIKYEKDGFYPHVTLTCHSADGEEGFPGDLLVSVTYALKDPYKLSVVMKAKALNKATPVNLAQHTYWNLGGHNSGDILSNAVQIFASHITPVDKNLIPTGEISPVKNTPYDFLKPRKVGSQINKLQNGYDINYALDSTEKMKPVAIVHEEKSGRVMDVQATAPGVQFYTANSLNQKGKGGYVYQPHSALCFETQGFPDAVNHPNFPSTIVTPGKAYVHTTQGRHFMSVSGSEIGIYELKKGSFSVKLTNYGARIISVFLPDKNGKVDDIVLGYDTIKEYLNDTSYFGALVGRVANRIGGAQFTLNGTHYKLVPNEGKNMLHGGPKGFSKVVWKVSKYVKDGPCPYITLTYFSPDGDQGFPGAVLASVTYALKDPYKLSVVFKAKALNKATPINLSHHPYWNIGGHNSGDILSNVIEIFGSHITLVDKELIPTGKIAPVKNTPYDFLKPRKVGSRIDKLQNGYDINYVLDDTEKMNRVGTVYDKKSGRVMDVKASAPGVQFYTSNWGNRTVKGKGGFVYQSHAALALETLVFPDAVNHPNFPSTIVNPGARYVHKVLYTFSIKKY